MRGDPSRLSSRPSRQMRLILSTRLTVASAPTAVVREKVGACAVPHLAATSDSVLRPTTFSIGISVERDRPAGPRNQPRVPAPEPVESPSPQRNAPPPRLVRRSDGCRAPRQPPRALRAGRRRPSGEGCGPVGREPESAADPPGCTAFTPPTSPPAPTVLTSSSAQRRNAFTPSNKLHHRTLAPLR